MNKNIIRKKYKAIAITAVLFMLTGCGDVQEWVQQDNQEIEEVVQTNVQVDLQMQEELTAQESSTAAEINQEQEIQNTVQTESQSKEAESIETQQEVVVYGLGQASYYAYEQLSQSDQELYEQIYTALAAMEEEITVSTMNPDKLNQVFNCIMNDHPELFYVEGYQYTKYSVADVITKITFFGTYSLTRSEAAESQLRISQEVAAILGSMPNTQDEYEKVKYLYEYVIGNTEYDVQADYNQDVRSVLLEGRSVCQGYAKTLQYLLQSCNIEALLVTGYTNREGHAWNLVKVNGAYYYVDPTWGDASYSFTEDAVSYTGEVPPNNYDYFLVTTEELEVTHQIGDANPKLPECTAKTDNYYVREGLYVETADEEQLKLIFEAAYLQETNYVTIKCGSEEVFEELKRKLLDEQKIFQLVRHDGSAIAYTDNQQQKTLSFWL